MTSHVDLEGNVGMNSVEALDGLDNVILPDITVGSCASIARKREWA